MVVGSERSKTRISSEHNCTLNIANSSSYLPSDSSSIFQRIRRAIKKSILISERNPQSTDYFRSDVEIFRIRRKHAQSKSYIIHPFSVFRIYYEIYMMVTWFVVIFYIPFDAAFDISIMASDEIVVLSKQYLEKGITVDYFGLFLKCLCFIDIIMTFFTGYPVKEKRKIVMEPLEIAKNYIFSIYFITDVLSTLPIGEFLGTYLQQRAYNSLTFLRILRLPTLYNYATRTAQFLQVRGTYIELTKNILINYLIFHWFACVIYLVPQFRLFFSHGISVKSWIVEENLPKLPIFESYIICIYRAVGSIFCTDFDNFEYTLWEESLVQQIIFIFGKVYTFIITVLILNILLRTRSLETKYFEIISQLRAYMNQKQLPEGMQTRLLQFYDYKYNRKFFKERGINDLLSDKVRGEIDLHICSKLVKSVAILSHLPSRLLINVVTSLKGEIYLPNDIIIQAGSVGDCMYFLASGTVAVWTPSGKEVCHLQDGAYFGEISLLFKDKRRTANIIAIEICEVFKLDRRAFRNTFRANPEIFKLLEDTARERMDLTQLFEDVHAKDFMELNN